MKSEGLSVQGWLREAPVKFSCPWWPSFPETLGLATASDWKHLLPLRESVGSKGGHVTYTWYRREGAVNSREATASTGTLLVLTFKSCCVLRIGTMEQVLGRVGK